VKNNLYLFEPRKRTGLRRGKDARKRSTHSPLNEREFWLRVMQHRLKTVGIFLALVAAATAIIRLS